MNIIKSLKKLCFNIMIVFIFISVFYIVFQITFEKKQESDNLENRFNSLSECNSLDSLYSDCLNYYFNPSGREISYCKDKVDIYYKMNCGIDLK